MVINLVRRKDRRDYMQRLMLESGFEAVFLDAVDGSVNGGAKLVHPGGAKLVHLTLCGTRCWGVVPVVHRRDPRCFE